MTRLRTVSPDMSGWGRRRQGRGFVYLDADQQRLGAHDIARCRALVIPPAWTEVWICPAENGHLQAVGTDDAGRRQYLYHPDWRLRRDREKFTYMLEFAARLPQARKLVSSDLSRTNMPLERATAAAFRLLDVGAFRIGSERYAEDNGSYGLLTLERRHVRKSEAGVAFDYLAKSGQQRSLTIDDGSLCRALAALRARRGPPDQRLLAFKENNRWHDLTTEQLSSYIKERLGDEATAKDFRTWHANVVAAAALAIQETASRTGRKRAISEAMTEVSDFLGNTPAVARSGYVDPRLVDLFEDGSTINRDLAKGTMPQSGQPMSAQLEKAVRSLLAR